MKTNKKLILLTVLFWSLFAITGNGIANAQKKQRLDSTPKAFRIFYNKFRNAVINSDKNIIVSLTQFPFQYGFDAGDEGTFSKTQFIEKFDDLLGGERKIFAQKNPVFYLEAGTYNLMDENDASHYIFEKKGMNYKFTAYVVEP